LLLKQPCHLFFPNSSSRFFFNFCISREDDFLGGVSSTFSFVAKSITSADSLTLSGDKSNFSDSRFNCFSTSLLSRIEAILFFFFFCSFFLFFFFFCFFFLLVFFCFFLFLFFFILLFYVVF